MNVAVAVLGAAFLAIYGPDIGHGFIKDDFAWIRHSAVDDVSGVFGLFRGNVGFYRPLVSATFALDYAVWQLNPIGYAITNLLLCAANALLVFAVARRLDLPSPAALVTAATWAFNFHGVNMALLWISGRTALLASAFALAAAYALLRGRYIIAGVCCLAALLSKEEAVMLPAILAGFILLDQRRAGWRHKTRDVLRRTLPLWMALAVYAALRLQSGAFGPDDAPAYYRFSFSLPLIARNIMEYADRGATVAIAVVVALVATVGRRFPGFLPAERRALEFSALWFAGMYALTMFLPSRSSLYAVLPSFGSAIAAGVCASAVVRADPHRFRWAVTALVTLAVILIPVYRLRNDSWVAFADISSRTLRTLQFAAAGEPGGGRIVLIDDPAQRFNLDGSFGGLVPDAVALFLGSAWTAEITKESDSRPPANLVFRYGNGTVVRVALP